MAQRFQVDLAGMVDLLSHHLYSGPQVYLRELLQNAADAVTARQALDPQAPATVRLAAGVDGSGVPELSVTDSGVGLTAAQAAEFLATIGRSSKRDETFGGGRAEFLGQFGIGLMAAFMVADRIEVVSRSATPGAQPIRWVGHADGVFDVTELEDDPALPIGSTVRLLARPGFEHWLDHETVLSLALDFGSLLALDVAVSVPVAGAGQRWRRITEPDLPWQRSYPTISARERALAEYAEQTLGFTPLGAIDLAVPLTGVSGVAYLLPHSVGVDSGNHRLYLKRMLLGPRVSGLLPDWAFFVRAVLNADALSPTASREQLHQDERLLATREALGDQMKAWLLRTLRQRGPLARKFLDTHYLALRALARRDDEVLDLVAEVMPYETSDGVRSLSEAAAGGQLLYAATTEAYRRVETVARAQGLTVVNAGYVYDSEVMVRLGRRPGWQVREVTGADLVQVLGLPSPAEEVRLAPALVLAREVLQAEDCDVIARSFDPDTVPSMLLADAEGEHRRDLARERAISPDLWGGLLDGFATSAPQRSRTLVLNTSSDLVARLVATEDRSLFAAGLSSVYLSAVMLAGEGLSATELASLHAALGTLLTTSLRPRDARPARGFPDGPDPE